MNKTIIKDLILKAVESEFQVKLNQAQINVEHPTLEAFGDYTTNFALSVARFLPDKPKQSPILTAEKITKRLLELDKDKIFSKIQAVPPGFINLTLSSHYLKNYLDHSLQEDLKIFKNTNNQKILVEHTSPNTNKPLHIGHVRNAVIGNAILNMLHITGTSVEAGNINNDRGIHIIKSMYGFLIHGKKSPISNLALATSNSNYKIQLQEWFESPEAWYTPEEKQLKPDHFVGQYYVLGNNDYEDSEKKAENNSESNPNDPHNQMQQMLIDWESNDKQVRKLWQQNNDWYFQGMHETLKDYEIKSPNDPSKFFDKEWYESDIFSQGKEIILNQIGNGVITEFEDGHIEAVLEKYKLPNVVLLRKNKTSLYITQDIELMRKRIIEDHYQNIFILTDSGQNLRFQQLFAICDSLGIADLSQMKHFGYGSVRLPEGKMSSRKGTVIQADDLFKEAVKKAREKINQERGSFTDHHLDQISKMVAIGAIKYSMLKFNTLSDITFDIQSSISFEGDTGPYIQYTHARASSILRKYLESKKLDNNLDSQVSDLVEFQDQEIVLIRAMHKYIDILVSAAKSDSPNYICEYLFDLAQKFNHFYTTMPIVSEQNQTKQSARLIITNKSIHIFKSALSILGIQAPEKM